MNELTRIIIEKRFKIVLKEFSFKTRQERDKTECPCYSENKPCHTLDEELNCLFCLCPEYDTSREEGGCKIKNPEEKGKWYNHPNLKQGKIWDCSDCAYPHRQGNIRKYLENIFRL